MKSIQAGKLEKSKSIMRKFCEDSDSVLLGLGMQSWIASWQDFIAERALQRDLQEKKKQARLLLKQKTMIAGKMAARRLHKGNFPLLAEVWEQWRCFVSENQAAAALADQLANAGSSLSGFSGRMKGSSITACERARLATEEMLYIAVFYAWKGNARIEARLRQHHAKIDAKRQQLMGVQSMFRDFATKLENGIKNSEADSGRKLLLRLDSRVLPSLSKDQKSNQAPASKPKPFLQQQMQLGSPGLRSSSKPRSGNFSLNQPSSIGSAPEYVAAM